MGSLVGVIFELIFAPIAFILETIGTVLALTITATIEALTMIIPGERK